MRTGRPLWLTDPINHHPLGRPTRSRGLASAFRAFATSVRIAAKLVREPIRNPGCLSGAV
jgi:hypothetical protein